MAGATERDPGRMTCHRTADAGFEASNR